MIRETWYDYFFKLLYEKYPKKADLAHALMELLCIEREAAYRRLRKEVMFPAYEIGKIAAAWNISLDELVGVNLGQVSFQMRQMNYIDPSEDELIVLRSIIKSIHYIRRFPNAEFMDICNKLPRKLLAGYEYLNQFYLFKWLYQYGNEKDVVPYSEASISENKSKLTKDYYHAVKLVPTSSFIWDRKLFDYLVSDIRYFHSIQLITDEEKDLIKNDLYNFLDYMLDVANKGCYPETQSKVNLYISQLHVDTNYSYAFSPESSLCYIHVFEKYELYTLNTEMIANFRTWMQLKKRTSVQISEVDERGRIEFFAKQRQLIDTL